MTDHAGGLHPLHRQPGPPRRGRAPPARARHLRRRRRAAGHAPRLLRAQLRRQGPDRRHRRVRGPGAARASMRCSSPRTSTRACTSSGTPSSARRRRRRRDRRWPRVRCASSAIPSRSSSPTTATSPRTPASSWSSTSTPCRRWSTTSPPSTPTCSCTRRTAATSSTTTALRRRCWTQVFSAAAARRRGVRPPAGLRRGADRDPRHRRRARARHRRDHHVGRDAGAARAPRVLRSPARHPGAPRPSHRPRHRWWVRPEDLRAARGDVHHARRHQAAGGA